MEACPIFAYYERNQMRECLARFCIGEYENCQRRQLRTAGQEVPKYLMPDGATIEPEKLMAPAAQPAKSDVRTVI
jgi:hypothetical protein